jgi:hypothetical protein
LVLAATVSGCGDDEHMTNFIIYTNRKENGFAVVRVLGRNMNPTNILSLMQIVQNQILIWNN